MDGVELFFGEVGVAGRRKRGHILSVESALVEGGRGVVVVVPVVVTGAGFESDRAIDSGQQAGSKRCFSGVDAGITGDKQFHLSCRYRPCRRRL